MSVTRVLHMRVCLLLSPASGSEPFPFCLSPDSGDSSSLTTSRTFLVLYTSAQSECLLVF